MGMYKHKMPDRELSSEMSRADYWEAQASMWHENYKSVMPFERQAEKYRDALESIAKGVHQGPRCHAIARRALGEKKDDIQNND